MGHPAYVRSRLAAVSEEHDQLIAHILGATDLQRAFLLLSCAAARPNDVGSTVSVAAHQEASLRRALSQLVSAPPTHLFWGVVSSAVLTTNAAYWSSSGQDSFQMIQRRHPSVAGHILHEL